MKAKLKSTSSTQIKHSLPLQLKLKNKTAITQTPNKLFFIQLNRVLFYLKNTLLPIISYLQIYIKKLLNRLYWFTQQLCSLATSKNKLIYTAPKIIKNTKSSKLKNYIIGIKNTNIKSNISLIYIQRVLMQSISEFPVTLIAGNRGL